jgi:hypothetical protein
VGAVIDIGSAGIQFRGAPVTLMSEGVEALLRDCGADLEATLRAAADVDPSGCIVQSAVGAGMVWAERFGCTFEQGRHEGGAWSVFLPEER